MVIDYYCTHAEVLPHLMRRGFPLLSSVSHPRFLSQRSEFAATNIGKDGVLPCTNSIINAQIVSSGTVVDKSFKDICTSCFCIVFTVQPRNSCCNAASHLTYTYTALYIKLVCKGRNAHKYNVSVCCNNFAWI